MHNECCPVCDNIRRPILEIYQKEYITHLVCENCGFREEVSRESEDEYLELMLEE